jgi:hypothetical protein
MGKATTLHAWTAAWGLCIPQAPACPCAAEQVIAALKKSKHLASLSDAEVKTMLQACSVPCPQRPRGSAWPVQALCWACKEQLAVHPTLQSSVEASLSRSQGARLGPSGPYT